MGRRNSISLPAQSPVRYGFIVTKIYCILYQQLQHNNNQFIMQKIIPHLYNFFIAGEQVYFNATLTLLILISEDVKEN